MEELLNAIVSLSRALVSPILPAIRIDADQGCRFARQIGASGGGEAALRREIRAAGDE
jgi:hypothetical protein